MIEVVIGLALLHALMTVLILALQELVHVVLFVLIIVQEAVMETVQLIVSNHVKTQKYIMTQREDEKLEMYM